MADTTIDGSDDAKQFIDLLKKLIEQLKSKRCYNSIKITRAATETGSVKGGDAAAVQAALDAAEDKATLAATDKVTKFADEWCKKGKCSDGMCAPNIDFTIDISGRETAVAAAGKGADVTFSLTVKATGQISCVCKVPD